MGIQCAEKKVDVLWTVILESMAARDSLSAARLFFRMRESLLVHPMYLRFKEYESFTSQLKRFHGLLVYLRDKGDNQDL